MSAGREIHPARFGLVAAAALALSLLAGSGSVAVAPSWALLGAVAVLVSVVLGIADRRLSVALAAALVCGAAAGHLLAYSGMPRVHDVVHLWGIWAYGRAVHDGHPYPLWLPYLGAGMPLFQFYGPLNFLLALPGILAGLSPMATFELELATAHALAALALFGGARLAGASPSGALIGAVAISFAPWKLAVFGYRGALGEAHAMWLAPLAAGAVLRLLDRPSRRAAAVLAGAACGLVLTHVVTLLTLAIALVPVIAIHAWRRRPKLAPARLVSLLGVPVLMAAALTAAWWVPVAFESRSTSLRLSTEDNPYYRYRELGVAPVELGTRRQWDRLRVALPAVERESRGLEGEQMPFYVGAVLILTALLAPWWSRGREGSPLAAGCLFALVLVTPAAARLVDGVPLFEHVRFPWRFLTPASVLAALALARATSGTGAAHGRAGRARLAIGALLVGLLVWDGAPYTGAADRIPPYRGVVHWYTEDPGWVHWERSMRPVVLETEGPGVHRVRNLELPPSEYAVPIDSFFPAYYEWLTPEIYRRYWSSRDPAALARAGVERSFMKSSPTPVRLAPRPYATLETRAGPTLQLARWSRSPGRIEVAADVAPGGGRLVVLEQAFPGWCASVDGGRFEPAGSRDGFLAVDLAAGPRRVVFDYRWNTWPRRAGLAVSLLAVVGLLVAAWWARRPRAAVIGSRGGA